MDIKMLFINSLYLLGAVFSISLIAIIIEGVTDAIRKQKRKREVDIAYYKRINDICLKKILEKEDIFKDQG